MLSRISVKTRVPPSIGPLVGRLVEHARKREIMEVGFTLFRTTDTRNAQPNSKRMKNGQPNINYLLEDEEIAEDLKTIQVSKKRRRKKPI